MKSVSRMEVNKFGRTYKRGKALSDDLRSLIIDKIVDNGGDIATGFFAGSFENIASEVKTKRDTVKKVWKTFCTTREFKRPKPNSGGVKKLQPDNLEFIEFLKTNRASMTTGELLRNVNEFCDLPVGTSKPALNRAVLNYMQQGSRSWKRIVRPSAEKFTPENIQYCEDFLNYISTVDPHQLKHFDEARIKLPDIANPNYGHLLVGTPCVEIMRNAQSPNITLNLLCGTNGIMYANTVKGASDTLDFLQFFYEASQCLKPDARSVLSTVTISLLITVLLIVFLGVKYSANDWTISVAFLFIYRHILQNLTQQN